MEKLSVSDPRVLPKVTATLCDVRKDACPRHAIALSDIHAVASQAEPPRRIEAVADLSPTFVENTTASTWLPLFAFDGSMIAGASKENISLVVPITVAMDTATDQPKLVPCDVVHVRIDSDVQTVFSPAVMPKRRVEVVSTTPRSRPTTVTDCCPIVRVLAGVTDTRTL